jgi:hypothetical protein
LQLQDVSPCPESVLVESRSAVGFGQEFHHNLKLPQIVSCGVEAQCLLLEDAASKEECVDNPIKTSLHHNSLLIENTAHSLRHDVASALAARRSAYLDMLAVAHETDFTPEMRRESSELRRRGARIMDGTGVNFEKVDAESRDFALKRSVEMSEILKDRIARRTLKLTRFADLVPTTAPPVDNSFWWAHTHPYVAPDTQADFRGDGLHFFAGPMVHNYDGEMHTSFGAVASFALQPARFPNSPSGSFISSPHVELFGGIVASAPDYDLIQGNGIASCELFLRQTILQMNIGATGPLPLTIAEAKGYDGWRIYLKNTGASRHADMPGFKLIPAVTYSERQVAPMSELIAEIEVRLDIYLNCAGALVWCDPEVLLRTFQWAPTQLP